MFTGKDTNGKYDYREMPTDVFIERETEKCRRCQFKEY